VVRPPGSDPLRPPSATTEPEPKQDRGFHLRWW
jgi:hypothetical protein